ncbi:MAG: DMT family transporter [Lachnospiraceae bacterium]
MENNNIKGHLAALVTIIIWGTTFISTKVLLESFSPVLILFLRFIIGLAVLFIVCPGRLYVKNKKEELVFALSGLCGICLYYLLENIALTYTMASNVGVIISAAPFFTAVLSQIFMKKQEHLNINFFTGFIISMAGICLISFNGTDLKLNITGDILALAAAFVWAVYSLLSKITGSYGYNIIKSTRRTFTYGIIFMLPALFFTGFKMDTRGFTNVKYLLNLVFLGAGASAMCFVTWNYAVKILGAVKTSIYIYIVPVVTVLASVAILHEKITIIPAAGIVLVLAGLIISGKNSKSS